MSCGFRIFPNNDVLVRIKLFPRFDGAEYVAVVGRMKQFHADQYRWIRGGSEAKRARGLPLTISASIVPTCVAMPTRSKALGRPATSVTA